MQNNSQAPAAIAHIAGAPGSPLSGLVSFFPQERGVLVTAQIHGLPHGDGPCASRVFGFHIHEGDACTPPDFESAGGHLDLEGCEHPRHAGDLPPLFGCGGDAYLSVLTDTLPSRTSWAAPWSSTRTRTTSPPSPPATRGPASAAASSGPFEA